MKHLQLFLLLALALGLVACGSRPAGSESAAISSPDAASEPVSSAVSSSLPEAVSSEPVHDPKADDFSALPEELRAQFDKAQALYALFHLHAPAYDAAASVSINGSTYYPVTDPRFPDYKSFYDALSATFTEDFIESELLAEGLYEPLEGKLYTCAGDRGANSTFQYATATLTSQTEERVQFEITAHYYDDYLPEAERATTKVIPYEAVQTETGWRFTRFGIYL